MYEMGTQINKTRLKIANAVKNWGSLQGNARINMTQAFGYLGVTQNFENLTILMDCFTEATDAWARMRGVHPNVFEPKDDKHIADICASMLYSEFYEVSDDPSEEV